jgi:putative phosphoribosyl transferase
MKRDYIFKNREDALSKLIDILPINILPSDNTVVVGISNGGLYLANGLASFLDSKLDILLTEPILSEVNPDLAVAMIGESEEIVMNHTLIDVFDISKDYIYTQAYIKYEKEILKNIDRYRDGLVLDGLSNKFVVLVDESVETGLTMMTAIKTVIALGAKNVFIAVPILDNLVYKSLIEISDDIFCPNRVDNYISIECYYKNLEPFSSKEVGEIMQKRKKSKQKGRL